MKINDIIRKSYIRSVHLIPTRKGIAKRLISKCSPVVESYPLGKEEKVEIKKIWGNLKMDTNWLRFFNAVEREEKTPFDARFIPMDIAYGFVYPYFNFQQGSSFMDDKNYYDMYFHDVRRPRTVCRVMNGVIMDSAYRQISYDDVVGMCNDAGKVIIKPSALTFGGRGITFYELASCACGGV